MAIWDSVYNQFFLTEQFFLNVCSFYPKTTRVTYKATLHLFFTYVGEMRQVSQRNQPLREFHLDETAGYTLYLFLFFLCSDTESYWYINPGVQIWIRTEGNCIGTRDGIQDTLIAVNFHYQDNDSYLITSDLKKLFSTMTYSRWLFLTLDVCPICDAIKICFLFFFYNRLFQYILFYLLVSVSNAFISKAGVSVSGVQILSIVFDR